MTTIADRATEVLRMLGNRNDLGSRVNEWIRASYVELAMGFDFEELEETHNGTTDAANNTDAYEYPEVSLNNNNWEVRAVKSITLHGNNNNRVLPLVRKDIRWIDKLPLTYGDPAIYCPFKNTIILRPAPSTDWTIRWRVWLKPLIVADNNSDIGNTEILLPDDWLEIVDLSAAMRGHAALLERDKAAELMQLLYGSEDSRTGRRIPGLIKQKMLRKHAEVGLSEYGINPRVKRYSK